MKQHNYRELYACFNISFPVDCNNPDLNLPPVPIAYSPFPNKVTWYTPDPIPYFISVAYEKSVSNFATPCDPPQDILLTYDPLNTYHTTMREKYHCDSVKIGYCARRYYGII